MAEYKPTSVSVWLTAVRQKKNCKTERWLIVDLHRHSRMFFGVCHHTKCKHYMEWTFLGHRYTGFKDKGPGEGFVLKQWSLSNFDYFRCVHLWYWRKFSFGKLLDSVHIHLSWRVTWLSAADQTVMLIALHLKANKNKTIKLAWKVSSGRKESVRKPNEGLWFTRNM